MKFEKRYYIDNTIFYIDTDNGMEYHKTSSPNVFVGDIEKWGELELKKYELITKPE